MAAKGNIASKYLDSIASLDSPTVTRNPLSPTNKSNQSNFRDNPSNLKDADLKQLEQQLHKDVRTPSKAMLIRSKFETPSATVLSFKSPQSKIYSSAEGAYSYSPIKRGINERNSGSSPLTLTPDTTARRLNGIATDRSPKSNTHNPEPNKTSGYEYLCRISAIKHWIESIIGEPVLQSEVELISYIKNGIHLAKISNVLLPNNKRVFEDDTRLQYRHTENINRFFQLLDFLNFPDLFRFELTDLYDAKNIPKVWLCLHHLSFFLHNQSDTYPIIQNLVGKASFNHEDVATANRSLSPTGLPNFNSDETYEKSIGQDSSSSIKGLSPIKNRNQLLYSTNRHSSPSELENPFLDQAHKSLNKEKSLDHEEKLISGRNSKRLDEPLPEFKLTYKPEENNDLLNTVKLQALIRGANFRFRMFVDRITLKSYSDEILNLVSIIRGNLSRGKTVHKHRDELVCLEYNITQLQSIIRRNFMTGSIDKIRGASTIHVEQLIPIIKGAATRNKVRRLFRQFKDSEIIILSFQSVAKGKLIRNLLQPMINNSACYKNIALFQSAIRRFLLQNKVHSLCSSTSQDKYSLQQLQCHSRGAIVRRKFNKIKGNLENAADEIGEFQSIIRGGIIRTRLCDNILVRLIYEDDILSQLNAIFRGKKLRLSIRRTNDSLRRFESQVISVQSKFRGILVRFEKEIKLEDAYESIDSLITFESIIRGEILRNTLKSIDRYYNDNIKRVIHAQSVIRAAYVRNAYHDLMTMSSPPLEAIRRFAYVLTDDEKDFYEDLELATMRDRLIQKSKANDEIEQKIESIDIKLGLLEKNKITLEDFKKNKNKHKSFQKTPKLGIQLITQCDTFNAALRKRIEMYQSMFYLLQTQPSYLTKLNIHTRNSKKDNGRIKNLFSQICALFPIRNTSIDKYSREEYQLGRFIVALMNEEVKLNCKSLADIYEVQNCSWIEFFMFFNNHLHQRQHLKGIADSSVKNIIDNEELDFESNPCVIYETLRNKEIKSRNSTERKRNVSAQVAIQDKIVSDEFVRNLMNLRYHCANVITTIEQNLRKLPLLVRVVCQEAYKVSSLKFPKRSDSQHLSIAGIIFIKYYFGNIFCFPENFGYQNKPPHVSSIHHSRIQKNFNYLIKVLVQIFSLEPFTENFLKPLNEFIVNLEGRTKTIIRELINVNGTEEYKFNEFDDILSNSKPEVTMYTGDMISLEKSVTRNIELLSSGADDSLQVICNSLMKIDHNTEDLVNLTELGNITLQLKPMAKDKSLEDIKSERYFSQVKRCILYMIQVQGGNNLLELCISGINEEHERIFRSIVQEEKTNSRTEVEKARPTSFFALNSLSYRDLKKNALESLLQLERMELISRKNYYQEVLNQLANDIKNKHIRRIDRKSQIDSLHSALKRLDDKETILKSQLKDYNNHVESVLEESQSKPKDKKLFSFIPIFSKQYFYQRELKKSNRLPKFGSYKFNLKKLLEQNIILDLQGSINTLVSTSSKLDFIFSCHKAGTFIFEITSNSIAIPGASNDISLDELLNYQYENKKSIQLFEKMVIFDTNNLIAFIIKKFYDIKRE